MKNLSIKVRLIAAMIIFIIAFTSFGIFTISKVRELERVTNTIYDDPLKVSGAAIEARVDIIKMQRQGRDMLSFSDLKDINKAELELLALESKVSKNLDIIKSHALKQESIQLEEKIGDNFIRWKKNHEQMVDYLSNGRKTELDEINEGIDSALIDSMETNLKRIDDNAKTRAAQLVQQAGRIQGDLEILLIVLNIGLAIFVSILFTFVIRSIISSIHKLQQSMNESAVTGVLKEAVLDGDDEISGIAKYYNILIQKLRNQFWLKDGQNYLNQELSTAANLEDMAIRTLNFIVNTMGAGKGALYIYSESTRQLELQASYAYTEQEQKLAGYGLGEGIIGQVGYLRKPILLENIKACRGYITTGILLDAPVSIYVFPLVYEDKIQGVIELAAYDLFNDLKREFLDEASSIIAANVYSQIQSQKVKSLLEISEKAQMEAKYNASQLLRINQVLEVQQLRLQEQSEQLQQTNNELEEQQQLMQQQSMEQQQTNIKLEEQQYMLEEQTKLLNMRNNQLETSRLELLMHSKELESANKYKLQFLANMSHELRTPLNSIILLSRLLMRNENDELKNQQLEKLNVIYNSGQELLRLINDILDLSKIEAGKMNVSLEAFHSADLLQELKQLFESAVQEKNIRLVCKDSYNGKLYGDYNKIAQIMRNLVSNAIKFTSEGTVSVEIESDPSIGVLMKVSDTGIGIPKDNLTRVFEEFQQGDGSISRKYGGTGLGLSISKRLAEIMNAEILVQSEDGKGSIFTLCLMDSSEATTSANEMSSKAQALQHLAYEEVAATKSTEKALFSIGNDKVISNCTDKTNKHQLIKLQNKKILIVDDDPRNIFVLASSFEAFGAEIIEAENGKVALELLSKEEVDLVLMDIMMPAMDGYEAIKAIRSSEKLSKIPIIAVTAKCLKDDRSRCIEAGADDYISKPIDYETLVSIVESWISK